MLFEEPTTAEYMVHVFGELIENYLHNELNVSKKVQLTKMVLYETADSYATVEKDYEEVEEENNNYEQLSLFDEEEVL